MDRHELPLEPRHLGVPSGASKNDFLRLWYIWRKPCTYLAPTLTSSTIRPKQDATWPMSPRSSIRCVQNKCRAYGTFSVNSAPILHQEWHNLPTDRNELPVELHHLGVLSGASKTISPLMVRLTQTVHLSCTDANSISKWTNSIMHMTHVT
jgi:hypothetical protein